MCIHFCTMIYMTLLIQTWYNYVKCFCKYKKKKYNMIGKKNLQAAKPATLFLTPFRFISCITCVKNQTLAVQCVYSKPWATVGACSLTAMSWGSTATERLEICNPAALHELSHLFRVAGIWLWRIMQCVAGNEPWGESQQGTTSPLTCLNPVDHETWLEFWLVSTDPSESQELWVNLTAQSVITYKLGRDLRTVSGWW